MSATDNFDALWGSFKEQVADARKQGGDRDMIRTDVGSVYGGKMNVWKGDEDGATVYMATFTASIKVNAYAEELRAFAAQCLAAAEEIEEALDEAQVVRPGMKPLPSIPRITMPVDFPSIRTEE